MRGRLWLWLGFLLVLTAGAVAIYPGILRQPVALPAAAPVTPEETPEPLAAFQTEREQLRAMQIAQLNDIVYGEKTDEGMRAIAQQKLLEVMDWSEKEMTIEGVLRARGYEGAVATVHTDSASILIKAQTITRQESAVILELVLRETGLSGGNVKIIPIN